MSDAYSCLKAFRHLDILQGILERKPTRPAHVEMILYDLCNQNCKFCAYRMEGYASNQLFNDRNAMPLDKALEIVDDCAELGASGIQFTGGGEPTIYPGFLRVIQHTHLKGLPFSVVTNGVMVTPGMADWMSRAAWVRVSLDAATESTYTSMRRCPSHHWKNAQLGIERLAKAKIVMETNLVLGVGFVITPNNWREVALAAKLAKDLGADNFRISAQFSNEDEKLFEGFHAEAAALCREAESLEEETFRVHNRFGERLDDLRSGPPVEQLCGYQIFTTYIGADLAIYRCCGYAYNERGFVGTVKDKRFKDFWMSQERLDNQLAFDGRGCERCQFRHINVPLAYALDQKPKLHEEFV